MVLHGGILVYCSFVAMCQRKGGRTFCQLPSNISLNLKCWVFFLTFWGFRFSGIALHLFFRSTFASELQNGAIVAFRRFSAHLGTHLQALFLPGQ